MSQTDPVENPFFVDEQRGFIEERGLDDLFRAFFKAQPPRVLALEISPVDGHEIPHGTITRPRPGYFLATEGLQEFSIDLSEYYMEFEALIAEAKRLLETPMESLHPENRERFRQIMERYEADGALNWSDELRLNGLVYAARRV